MSASLALASAAYVSANSRHSGCSAPMSDEAILGLFIVMCVGFLAAAYGAVYGERDYYQGRGVNAMLYGIGGLACAAMLAIFIGLGVEVFT